MNRRQLLVGSTTAITAGLAGCLSTATGSESTDSSDERTISVSNSAEVAAEPDQALMRTSIEVTGDDAASVRDKLNKRADTLRDGLLDAGLDDDQITTDRFQVRDRIDRRRAEQAEVDSEEDLDEFRYYVGTHRFQIEVQDVDEVGSMIDTAIDSGADSVGRIVFTLSDDRRAELRNEALEDAIDEAREEAEFIADEVDVEIDEVQAVDTSEGRVSPVRTQADEVTEEAADTGTSIDTDDVTVRASASVRYRIS